MSTSPDTGVRSRARPVLGAVASICALALLWAFRPSLAGLPRSLEEPLTATAVQDFGLVLAWAAIACLAVLVLGRGLRSTAKPRRTVGAQEGLRSRPVHTGRHSRSLASAPLSSALPEQVVLTLSAPVETPAVEQDPRAEASDEAPSVSVSVLGPVQITGGKRRRRRLRASAQELITYLALHSEGASRDQLLEALWPGEDPKRSEQRLWQSTSDVRRVLGEVVRRERDRYRLDRAGLQVDLEEFESLLEQASRSSDEASRLTLLERAHELVRGEPLDGTDYLWADGEIRRLRAAVVDLLEQLGRARLAAGDARGALAVAERGIEIDLLNEGLWRLALRAEAEIGLREAVETRYERLRSILDERLGLGPAQETRTLYRDLLGQN